MDASGELQCVGWLEIAAPPPARYLRVGSLPVPTDDSAYLPALLPSASPTGTGAPRYQMLPLETDLNTLPVIPNLPEKVFPTDAKSTEGDLCRAFVVIVYHQNKILGFLAVCSIRQHY
ncbi:hypothetical protein ACQJBY_024240 [Aegilops geniculata]